MRVLRVIAGIFLMLLTVCLCGMSMELWRDALWSTTEFLKHLQWGHPRLAKSYFYDSFKYQNFNRMCHWTIVW